MGSIFHPTPRRGGVRLAALAAAAVAVAGLGLAVVVGHPSKPGTSEARVNVVAGENFWGSLTEQIGGDHVRVTSILSDPAADPHLYESDAKTAAAVSRADLVISNGLGYDDFLTKLVAASPNKHRDELSVEKTLHIRGDNPNPHLWYDIPRVSTVADAIARALVVRDPAHASVYRANLDRFDQSLKPLLAMLAAIRAKHAGAPVAYTERVPGYLLADAGLTVKTPPGFAQAIEDGNEPSPGDVATLTDLITNHDIKLLLYNSQATSSVTQHIQTLAKQAGTPVVAVTETVPPSEKTYQSWQLDQLRAIQTALGN